MGQLPAEGSGSIALTPASQPRLGGYVSFDCLGLGGLRNPRVWVAAMQDDAVVYGAGGSPTELFKLGGDSSLWQHAGGAAECTAELYYILNARRTGEWNGRGAQGGTVSLAELSFEATG